MSFNPNLTDFGIATFIASLPTTAIELGLVDYSHLPDSTRKHL